MLERGKRKSMVLLLYLFKKGKFFLQGGAIAPNARQ